MKTLSARMLGTLIGGFVFAVGVFPQGRTAADLTTRDKYVISAKAGGVNFVNGTVGVVRNAGSGGYLFKGDTLDIGDRVSTGADGKAEVLLNPGSYMRLGPASAVEFKTTELEDLQIRLDSGSAIFEVFATPDFTVTVDTPKSRFVLIESGIYRVDVAQDGSGKILVSKGKAQLGEQTASIIKSGREGSLVGGQASINKFNRSDRDELDVWSKGRAKELTKITGSLQRDNMRTALMRSFLGRQWNLYNSFGVWVYDPFRRSHCFLPFGWGWNSPYGYGFASNIYYYNLPPVIFAPPPGGTGSGPGSTIQTVKPGRISGDMIRPPFAQVQGTTESTGRGVSSVKPGRGSLIDSQVGSDPVRSSGGFSGSSSGTSSAPVSAPVMDSKPGRRP